MKVRFYCVRHGETRFNLEDRFQGWCDGPLTEKGIHQAETAHDYLENIPFSFACCSTALRTRRTAQIVLKGRDVPLLPLKGLKEGKAYIPNCGVFSFDAVNGEHVFSDYMKAISE